PTDHRALQAGVVRVPRAFARAHEAAMADPELGRQFGLEPWEEQLIGWDPGFTEPSPTSRLDPFFLDGEGLRFTEYNAETPAGAGYNDALSTTFYGLPVMRRFLRRYDVRPLPARHGGLRVRVGACREWGGRQAAALAARRASRPGGRVRAGGRPEPAAGHRDSRLARRADLQRVPAVPGLFPGAGTSPRDRR